MDDSRLTYALEHDIAIITMDDGKANVLHPDMIQALNSAIDKAESEAKAIILAGRPGRFSAGFDLKVMATGPDAAMSMISAGGELFMRIYALPLPVVMAVTGHAIAGGVLLAATGDVRIGIGGEFKLGLNEVENGMPVPVLAHELARDRLRTSEFIPATLHAKMYAPDEAAQAGWLDMVVAPEELAKTAMAEATRLGALHRNAYAATKVSLRKQTIELVKRTMDNNLAQLVGKK